MCVFIYMEIITERLIKKQKRVLPLKPKWEIVDMYVFMMKIGLELLNVG